MFSGAFTAVVTPFKDGHVDEDALRRLIRFGIDGGVSGIVPCGTTGESPTLSHEEHNRVIELTVKEVAGQVKVIAGTGSNSTEEALALTEHAKSVGADACLMVSPYYNKPTQEGLFQHFKTVAEAVDIPIVLYNIQGRTAVNIENSTVAKLSRIPNIVAVKEASGSILQMSEVIRLTDSDFDVLSGDDQMTFPLMALGGKGVISVVTNIVPDKMSLLVKHMLKGDIAAARAIHFEIYELCQAMFIETNPIPIKTALSMMGMIRNEFRLPLCPMSQANQEKLKTVLERYGLV
ncbi:4-hydroxy-tetrahydrodipicolinate synthase [Desulfomonile tiedjei]|uniref:4-hydroxy-tetrahydrodipicolinate synthase n=1 Tax=Desulfomonile tiedjei (strain ATCC 49306 / DSM 6799 / DCB-1) TaxID=706587 RepID=I4C848_DESTA|nr:4-hydroxy-tetrahydrodipicolinate synthase [Desulfomonile tiedjei]AFM25739.1 dihydrodipicolinate synthase [Desulfomonile tiedjei DSM 6799]